MSGWNVNASSFVPNANARPFVPGQPYAPPAPAEPAEDWEAQADPSPVPPPVVEEAPAPLVAPVETPAPAAEPPKKEPTPDDDGIAPLAKKFQRTVYVDDGTHKEHINMVFVGHVDAGKSTIGGQLMFLTGMVDKRTLEKYEREAKEKGRESWYLSWCMDTNDEEREKGKTVEVGRAYFETEKRHFTILDAPGHKSFVPNMIAGATQADLAVLVISARRGEFETGFDRGGQTREHSMLVKTAGVKHLVILVNKMDDPTVKWEEERFREIEGKLTPYLRKLGFNPKTDITYIPCSGLTGSFLKDRPSATEGNWYSGPCFIEFIDCLLPSFKRDFDGPVRCIVVEKYSEMGTVIIGKMESGCVQKGDTLVVMPNKQVVQVLQIWADDVETDRVVAGDNIKFKLKGIEEAELQGGFIICSPDSLAKTGKVFDAEVLVLEHKSIIASGYSCVLHIQSAVEEVSVRGVIATIDKKTGEKKRAKFVKQDEKCIMRLESPEPFVLEPFKEFPYLGRFTLRDEGKTIAIGKVLKVVE
uniref:Tr-type G domain-containing protein n=1 Tax=Caenorhabditis japonica TaxID=281687 RepID=A0A8R1DVQ6_CAEJA